MNTFLDVCRRLHLLLRIGEDKVGTAPASVIGQEGVLAEIVEWVRQANADIQSAHPAWSFMTGQGTLTVSSRTTDPRLAIGDYAHLLPYDASRQARFILIYKDSTADETPVYYVAPQQWGGGVYDIGTRGQGRPYRFTVNAGGLIELDPVPDEPYTLRFEYRRSVQDLQNDADVPLVPQERRMAIVYHAIVHFYCLTRDATPEFRAKAEASLRREMQQLFRDYSPEYTIEAF
jgi:hypothetical protein